MFIQQYLKPISPSYPLLLLSDILFTHMFNIHDMLLLFLL